MTARPDTHDDTFGQDDPAVEVTGLTKRYHTPGALRRQAKGVHGRDLAPDTLAIDELTIRVERGEVYGVLGPNGAGKTTLMKVLGTILLPDAGTAKVFGHDLATQADRVRHRIGIVLGEYERSFHWRLTGRQNLRFFADFYRLPKNEMARRINGVLETVGLSAAADRRFNEYSTGMKHRLALARGLLPDPDLLILDEPTAGLDAESSGQIAEVVRARASEGTTVLYTTHRIHEAGVLCDRILILNQGKAIAEATPDQLALLARGSQVLEVTKRSTGPWESSFVQPLAERDDVVDWETRGERLLLYTTNDEDVVHDLFKAIHRAAEGRMRLAVTVRPPNVEDAFLTLVKAAREQAAQDPRMDLEHKVGTDRSPPGATP